MSKFITNAKQYACAHCPKVFLYKSQLEVHSRVHSGIKPYNCKICSRKFSQMSGLQCHQRIHTGYKPYVCHRCPRMFAQQSNLTQHLKNYHSGPMKSDHLAMNTVTHRTLPPLSDMNFDFTQQLLGNIISNENVKPEITHEYDKHRAIHCLDSKPQLALKKCKETFTSKTLFVEHQPVHNSREKQHCCQLCGVSFSRKSSLISHNCIVAENTQENEETNSCKICNKTFVSKNYHAIHMKRHKGDLAFSCTFCSKRYVTLTRLQFHIQLNHKIESQNNTFLDYKVFLKRKIRPHRTALERNRDEEIPPSVEETTRLANAIISSINQADYSIDFTTAEFNRCTEKINGSKKKLCMCKKCNRQFSSGSQLTQHSKSQCLKSSFRKRRLLIPHKERLLVEDEMCSVCGTIFSTQTELQQHNITVTRDNIQVFCCCKCKTMVTNIVDFHIHQIQCFKNKSHSVYADKSFSCKICSVHFTYPNHLKMHIESKKHREIKFGMSQLGQTFRCQICCKKFPTRIQMLSHNLMITKMDEKLYFCCICYKKVPISNHYELPQKNLCSDGMASM